MESIRLDTALSGSTLCLQHVPGKYIVTSVERIQKKEETNECVSKEQPKVIVGVLCCLQQPGSYLDMSSAFLSFVGVEPTAGKKKLSIGGV